jgi:hypothetical protein
VDDVPEKTYPFELTEGEIIVIRQAVRRLPRSDGVCELYGGEVYDLDKKMTAKLAEIFDERHKP